MMTIRGINIQNRPPLALGLPFERTYRGQLRAIAHLYFSEFRPLLTCIGIRLVEEIDVRPSYLRVSRKIRTDEEHLIYRTLFCDELAIS